MPSIVQVPARLQPGARLGPVLRLRSGLRPLSCAVLAATLLAACTVGPDYTPPAPPGSAVERARWTEHRASEAEVARTEAWMRDWWAAFHDPVLDQLVARAISANLDIRIAGQRLLAAGEVQRELAANLRPQLSGGGEAGIARYSTTLQYPPLPGISSSARLWEPGFSASWELDVFGRVRRQIEAQRAVVGSDVELRRGVMLTAVSEVADDYLTLRVTQRELAIAGHSIGVAGEALGLTQRLFNQGIGTSLQLAQARAELESEQSTLQPLQLRVAQLSHAIAVLLGLMPGSLEAMLSRPAPLPEVPPLPVTLPATVLANRPDIRRAERQYAEAVARIGVAVAQLYPDFSLPLSFGLQSSMIHELMQADSLAFQFVLSIAQPIYQGGRISAQVREARDEAEGARLDYQRTVLTAFREVEDGLVAYHDDSARSVLLHRAAADNALALSRARRLYAAGLTPFLDVLTAERATYQSESDAAASDLARLSDAVQLYTALGAGWQGEAAHATTLPVDLATEHALAARRPARR